MKKLLTTAAIFFCSQSLFAQSIWKPNMNVDYIRVHKSNWVFVKFTDKNNLAPEQTCNSWNTNVAFRIDNEVGKSWLGMLRDANMYDGKVSIWYTPSKNPNAINEACSVDVISQLDTLATTPVQNRFIVN